jgi:hypothetical protein
MAMTLRALRAVDDPADTIPDPFSDPEYAAAMQLLSAFNARYDRLGQEKLRLHYEQHFQARPFGKPDSYSDQPLRARLAALSALPPLEPTPVASPASPSPAIARGLAVLAGEKVDVAPSIGARIAECDRQLEVLSPAISAQTEICQSILGEITVRFAKQLLPAWNALVLQMFRDAQALSQSTQRFREYRASVMARGIHTDRLRNVNVASPLQLGAETDPNSEITFWRRTLEDWGVLP